MKTDNELIAGFMAMTCTRIGDDEYEEFGWLPSLPHSNWCFESAPPFDKSWDWLMPVVEKINSGYGTINIDSDSVFVHSENDLLTHIYDNQSGSKIGAVYAAVVFFIKWYNGQSTSPPQ
jgi:hypothetical protein